MKSKPIITVLGCVTLLLAGCATSDFRPYSGAQQVWPTSPGAFIETKYAVPAYFGLPPMPYEVLGYLNATTGISPLLTRGGIKYAASRAKQIGGDAIIVLGEGAQYLGTVSGGSGYTSYGGGSATSSYGGASVPLYQDRASVIIIKFKKTDYADVNLNSGNAKYSKGDLDGAIADYTKAIELKPDVAGAYGNRGAAKQIKGDLDGAIADYTKAIELKPDHEDLAAAYTARGLTKRIKGDFEGAIADCTKAIELKPDNVHLVAAYAARGIAKQGKGDLDDAIADDTKAIELKPDNVNLAAAYFARGIAKAAKGDLNDAISDCTKAIELKPDFADAYFNRGYIRYDSHDFTDALFDFRKAAELDSSNDYARFWVWLIRARLGERESATTELQTYLAGRANGKLDDWASKIGHFLAGQLAEPELLAAAKNADQKKEAGQLCEAYFYAGSKHLFAGDKSVAEDYFEKSIATDYKAYLEYASAVAELKSLEKQK